jgi:hypothetical protein
MLRAAFILTGYTLTCFSFRRMLEATKPAQLNSVTLGTRACICSLTTALFLNTNGVLLFSLNYN